MAGGRLVQQASVDLQSARVVPGQRPSISLNSSTSGPYLTYASFAAPPLSIPPIGIWHDHPMVLLLSSGIVNGARMDSLSIPTK